MANLNTKILPYAQSFWPAVNGLELLVPSTTTGALINSGTAQSFNNPAQSIHENFGTMRADYAINDRDSLSAAYTIDDGNSVIPLSDPLFASGIGLRAQVASLRETHIFSPRVLSTFTAGFSRAAFNLDSLPLATFAAAATDWSPARVRAESSLAAAAQRRTSPPSLRLVPMAPPEFGIAAIFSPTPIPCKWCAASIKSAPACGSSACAITKTRLRGPWESPITSLTTFLQGNTSTFQVVPNPNELGWRSWMGAWFVRIRSNCGPG